MAIIIRDFRFSRGPESRLPLLALGEPAVTSDTGKVYIGGPNGNILVNAVTDSAGSLVFDTLAQLQAAYPNGTDQPVWVRSQNEWYYWGDGTVPPVEEPTPTPTTTDYLVIPSATSKLTSGTTGWKGNTLTMNGNYTLSKVSLGGNGTPTTLDIWSVNIDNTLNAKLATGTYGTKEADGFYAVTLATPLALTSGSRYLIASNFSASGASYTDRVNGADTTAFVSTTAYFIPAGTANLASGLTLATNYVYDYRLTLE